MQTETMQNTSLLHEALGILFSALWRILKKCENEKFCPLSGIIIKSIPELVSSSFKLHTLCTIQYIKFYISNHNWLN